MKITIASGKGGTGKTMIATSRRSAWAGAAKPLPLFPGS